MFRSDKRFACSRPEQITRVEINNRDFAVVLEKTGGGWAINETHLANKDMIDNMKLVISKLKVEYPLPKMYAETITDSLIVTEGMHVKLYVGKSLKKSYYLYASDSLECIGLIEGKKQAYSLYMSGFTVNPYKYLSANPSFWLDNIAFSYYPNEIVSVEVENMHEPRQSFKIKLRGVNDYKLIDSYNLREAPDFDTLMIKRYLTYFNMVAFDSYPDLSEEDKQEILLSDYAYVLHIETKNEKNSYRVIYIPVNDELDAYGNPLQYDRQYFYLSMNNGNDIAKASWLVFDILLKNLLDFVDK
jgi:hypothetical protein